MSSISKAKSGDPLKLKAADWNALAEHVNKSNALPGASELAMSAVQVTVRNATGADTQRFAFLKPSGVVVSPTAGIDSFCDGPVFDAVIPQAGEDCALFCSNGPMSPLSIGSARASGVCVVQFSTASSGHGFAVPDGAGGLRTSDAGAVRVLYCEGSGSAKWGAILLGGAGGGDTYKGFFKLSCIYEGGVCYVHQSGGWFFINGAYMQMIGGNIGVLPFNGTTYHIVLHYHQDLDADGNVTARSYGIEGIILTNPSVMNATDTDARWLIGTVRGLSGGAVEIVQQSHGTPYFFTLSLC